MEISELSQKVQQIAEHTQAKKALEAKIAEIDAVLKGIKAEVLQAFEENKLDNFKIPGVGMVYLSETENFPTPQGNENKRLLFDYITNKYGYEDLLSKLSIHSKTLNSWAKAEIQSYRDSGDAIFSIPGLGESTVFKDIRFRKK